MGTYADELHESYQKTIRAFTGSYPYITYEITAMIDNYCRTCAMLLWHSFAVGIQSFTNCLNAIYTEDALRKTYSTDQVENALRKLAEKEYFIPAPSFFREIIKTDVTDGTNYSRRLAACFSLIFLSFALIDGVVEYEEAHLITELRERLIKECDSNQVIPYFDNIDPYSYVDDNDDTLLFVTAERDGISPASPECSGLNEQRKDPEKTAPVHASNTKKPSSIMTELDSLIGLDEVKTELKEISDFIKVQRLRQQRGLPTSIISYHLVFTGNPGTGKTKVARFVAKLYKNLGIVSKGHLIEVTAKDLVAGYVGQTAIKTGEVIEKALGGVLFIDEAYMLLSKDGQGYGQEAIDTLLKEMEDHRDNFAVIVAGYDDLMTEFIESNPGLKSRFNKYIHFDDYSADQLMQIFRSLCEKNAYILEDSAACIVQEYFTNLSQTHGDDFANARSARNYFEKVISKQAGRIASKRNKTEEMLSTITEDDVSWSVDDSDKEKSLDELVAEFNSLIGLEMVKEELSDLIIMVQHQQKRKAQGLKVPSLSLHLVFMGNPGTGKTTVARYVAQIYKSLGLLSKGHLVETDRSGLVAGYVGQTALKTQECINNALGGVLFIDEAYTLAGTGGNDFGQEAIDTLLKAMEDKRDNLVVIVAGYDDLMDQFIQSNPGLASRFNRYIHFEDYTSEEMFSIFSGLCDKSQYVLSDDAITFMKDYFTEVDIAEIGNGRGARNLFEKVVTQQARRVQGNVQAADVDLSMINATDIEAAIAKG